MSTTTRWAAFGLSTLFCTAPWVAYAQSVEVETSTTGASGSVVKPESVPASREAEPLPKVVEDDRGLEVFTITAQKRAQDLQDVPISITALDSDTFNSFRAGGADVRLLSARIPSLTIESSFGRVFPRMYIRGLGNTDFDLNASQPVSLVVDNVVLENPIVKSYPLFDIERVEVLRGPQGTLFGRNTPAGVVKFDTNKPTDDFEAYARFGYGQFNYLNFEGAASGRIIPDLLNARVSLLLQQRGDWVDNLQTDAKNDLEGFSQAAARFQLDFLPVDGMKLNLNAHAHSQEGTARVFRANIIQPGTSDFTPEYKRDEVQHDGANSQTLSQYGFNANLDYDFGSAVFTTIFSFERASFYTRGDIDGGFGASFAPPFGPGFIPFPSETADAIPQVDQYTVETRLATDNLEYVNAQVGVFYFDEDLDIESFSYNTLGGGGLDGYARQTQRAQAFALFGAVMVDPTPELHLQAGLRWSDEFKELVAERLTSPIGAGATDPLTADTKADFVSWDVSAAYDIFRDISAFVRVARGFRAPSIQGRVLFGDTLSVADTEKVLSYEVGTRTRFLSNRARVNVTGFYYEITDQQLTAVGGAANFNTLLNAEKGIGYGVEVDTAFLPTSNLELSFGGSYNYTQIRDPNLAIAPCGSGCTVLDPPGALDGTVSINGNRLPNAPRLILNANATYSIRVHGAGEVYINTDWAYRSRVYFFLYESEEYTDAQLLEIGARIGYRRDDNRADIALYARNLFNDNSRTGGIDFNNLTGFVNEPRLIGVEGTFRF